MGNLIRFELYKINKQNRFRTILASLVAFQLLMAVFIKYNEDFMSYQKAVQYSFLAPILVNLNIIFLASKIFAEDFEYLTIIPIKTKIPKLSKLMLAKLMVHFLIHLALAFVCGSFTLILSLLLLKYKPSGGMYLDVYLYNFSMILPMAVIVLLMSILILIRKKEKPGLILGIIIYLFYGFGTGFNFLLVKKLPIFKYGIVNLMNLPNQLLDSRYADLTQLTIVNMVAILSISLLVELLILNKLSRDIEI